MYSFFWLLGFSYRESFSFDNRNGVVGRQLPGDNTGNQPYQCDQHHGCCPCLLKQFLPSFAVASQKQYNKCKSGQDVPKTVIPMVHHSQKWKMIHVYLIAILEKVRLQVAIGMHENSHNKREQKRSNKPHYRGFRYFHLCDMPFLHQAPPGSGGIGTIRTEMAGG
jgi:hypothetical protein